MSDRRGNIVDAAGAILGLTYVLGYFVVLIAAGISAWPRLGFWAWLDYMQWQALYATVWPVWLVGGLVAGIVHGLMTK